MNNDHNSTCIRLQGRIYYLRNIGRIKDPDLMMQALKALEELANATKCLLDDLGKPEDGPQANLMDRCRKAVDDAIGA